MIIRRLLALILLVLPVAASAQEGSIRYDHSVQFDLGPLQRPGGGTGGLQRRPEGGQSRMPTGSASTMVLTFNANESLMRKEVLEDAPAATPAGADRRGFGMRMMLLAGARGSSETVVAAYHNNADGTFAEARDFMGRTFLIRGETPTYEWRLVGEQSEFMGYMVQKATTMQDSTMVEAWFTPEIPVSAGPGPYGGLPGMILVVSVDRGKELYSAVEIDLTALADGAIAAPDEGEEVSPEEYEQIVEEKLAELRAMRGRIR